MAVKALVIANWKMNPSTWRDAKRLLQATKRAAEKARRASVVVAPPAIYLRDLRDVYRGKRVQYGVQHAHFETGGAETGEISLSQATASAPSYAIVGHAERRSLGESNDDTRRKVAAALALKMTPILCVGEKERKNDGEHFALVREQLRAGFTDVAAPQLQKVFVVYEPLWTIGKEKAMSPRDMHEMAIFIRKTIVDFKGEGGMKIKILYGGSIDAENAGDMLKLGDVQGFLVGRASQNPSSMSNLLQAIEAAV